MVYAFNYDVWGLPIAEAISQRELARNLIVESILYSVDNEMNLDEERVWDFLVVCSEFARGASTGTKEQIINVCKEEFKRMKKIAEAGGKVKKEKTHKETLLEGKKELLKEKDVKRW